ncbi:unnamed protein product [Rotaria sp. Silwood1]|nr:unnamed protein product [Rotaria sp. Silwood1]
MPIVTPSQITNEKATVNVSSAWFQPVKPILMEKIHFSNNYNKNSPADVSTYERLSMYRFIVKNTDNVDFVVEPFLPDVGNTETLVVVLNKLAHQLGAQLTFTSANVKYNDRDYRTACKVTNLGSIHSFLASERNFQTAKFNLHFDLDYKNTTRSPEALRNFVLSVINDMCHIAECDKDFIRVCAVKAASSLIVEIGITTPNVNQTIEITDTVKGRLIKIPMAKTPSFLLNGSKKSFTSIVDKSNKTSTPSVSSILECLFPEKDEYTLESAPKFLELQPSDLDSRYNRNYTHAYEEIRSGHPYYFPQGWYHHALKVSDKYPNDTAWLGMSNGPGEWAVAYHGTVLKAVKGITDQRLLQDLVITDLMKFEAKQQNPSIPDVKGLYVATHCDGGAADTSSNSYSV